MRLRSLANAVLGCAVAVSATSAVNAVARGGSEALVVCGWRVVATLLLLLALRLKDERRISLALVLGASLMALWAADAVLSTRPLDVPPEHLRRRFARMAGIDMDPRGVAEVIRDLRAQGHEAYPGVLPGNHWDDTPFLRDTLYPLGGLSGALSVMCNEGSYVISRTDERGFSNPPGQWSLSRVDLVAVGDSYTQGWCVRPRDSFVALLRERHPATIALGIGASGPLMQLAQVREYLPAFRPRVVLWFYFETNDLTDLTVEKRHPILQRYLRPAFSQSLAVRVPQTDRLLLALAESSMVRAQRRERLEAREPPPTNPVRTVWSVLRLAHIRERFGRVLNPLPEARSCCDLRLYARIVREANATVAGWGGRLIVVYLPGEERISGRRMGAGARAGDSVVARLRTLGVPTLDLRAVLRALGADQELYAFRGAHLTARGHQAVAALVLRHLDSLGFLASPAGQ